MTSFGFHQPTLKRTAGKLSYDRTKEQQAVCLLSQAGGVLFWAVCLVVMLLLLQGDPSAQAETITYTDKLGRVVRVTAPVRRAVCLQFYELLPALNCWDQVCGVSRWAYKNDLILATRSEIAKTIPAVGPGTEVNMEALLKLKPDLVITWTFKPEQVQFMERQGLTVIAVYPESLSELYAVMDLFSRVFGKERRMQEIKAQMDICLSVIRTHTTRIPPAKRYRALWLESRPTSVAGSLGVTQDVLSMIGATNAAGAIHERSRDVTLEQIIAYNPDVIFIWGNASYSATDILTNPQWSSIKAVKTGRVYKAPEWSTWSPRLAPVALWMAARTYPEYYKDVNLEKMIDDFYRQTYGLTYKKVAKIEG